MEDKKEKLPSTRIQWYPGHMAKTKKQIIEDLKLVDIVIEIVDARAPRSSSNPELQEWIKNKKKIVVLNKSDLAQESINNEWVNYYKSQGIKAILANSNSGYGIRETISEMEKIRQEQNKDILKKGRVGKPVRAIIVGIPNVGKSSFMNRAANKTSAKVGNKPGVTRQKQWINIENNISLLDTPGILWPRLDQNGNSLNLAFIGTIKDEVLEKLEVAYYLLKYLLKNRKKELMQRYNLQEQEIDEILKNKEIAENENILEILHIIGRKRGAILQGNIIDEEKCAKILLEDFRTGKLGRITLERP